jgi:pyrroline-5-carboxylate reductase
MATTLAVAGFGNMGSAIIRGVLAAGRVQPRDIVAFDPDARCSAEAGRLGLRLANSAAALSDASTLLIAVKPQRYGELAQQLGALPRPALVISVMAGITMQSMNSTLGHHGRIARVMPNTPARIGAAMSTVAFGDSCTATDRDEVMAMFETIGLVHRIDESLMDAATAVCGSGPAYIFHLAEHMMRGAREAGFDASSADLLVRQTILGAAELLRHSSDDPATLRRAVTSPSGTTAAALAVLDAAGAGEAMVRAIVAARDRGRELSTGA